MGLTVFVKVVGFGEVERHAINTMFRLSQEHEPTYNLWTPDAPLPPQLALVDVDSYGWALELASPATSASLKLICIGNLPPEHAWRAFKRPILWPDIVATMDSLFLTEAIVRDEGALDIDIDLLADAPAPAPPTRPAPGIRHALLVDPVREHRMYLRARLALAGLVVAEEAQTGAQALELAGQRHFDLVITSLDLYDISGWKLIEQLVALEPAIGAVVLTMQDASWHAHEQAEQAGCRGVLVRPFDPLQVHQLLQRV
jgi:CheY-like chemotaxis protein